LKTLKPIEDGKKLGTFQTEVANRRNIKRNGESTLIGIRGHFTFPGIRR
jgi:hypothetical protein